MRTVAGILVLLAVFSLSAPVQAQKQELTDKEKARIQGQIDELKKSKITDAETANKNTKDQALRQGKAIDDQVEKNSQQIDRAVDNYSLRWGSNAARAVGADKKRELTEKAAAEKAKIAAEARKKGAARTNEAKKEASDIDQTVSGLKSQVSKSGKFGLKPKNSNLYVRTYGGKN